MSYSRRQLYALGEPLGDSATTKKVGGGRIYGGGGGSAPAPAAGPTQTTVQNTNIPDYAQPYVSNMLNAAQAQIYTPDMTGFNPYVPYSNNPADYVAGFSPLQQQAQSGAANLQTPGQYGMATGITGRAARQSGQLAGQEAMTGQNLAQASTNPYAVGAYMNPFIQNALAPAQQLLNQQYGMQGAAQQGAATQQGAFGGSRNALMQGLNQQNQMLAQNQLVGNAYQNAYNQALGQMNTVSSQGLAGQQAAMQGLGQQGTLANQLAGIGGQQLAAQQGIIGTQAQQGAAQQAQQQQIINQAVQNYATAQQYPMLQLGMLNSMLRGLPMQSTTTSLYQAQPTATQQAIGLGGTAAMLGSAFGKKEGGIVGMKKGGKVPGYKYGAVINDEQLQADAKRLGATPTRPGQPNPLQQRIQDPQLNPNERMIMQGVQADQNRLRQVPGAAQALVQAAQPPQPQMPNDAAIQQARMRGIGAAGGDMFNTMGYAGGGIIAFNGEDNSYVDPMGNVPMGPDATSDAPESWMPQGGIGTAARKFFFNAPGYVDFEEEEKRKAAAKKKDAEESAKKEVADTTPTDKTPARPPVAAPGAGPAAPQFKSNMALGSVMDTLKERQAMAKELGIDQGGGEKYKALMGVLEQQQAKAADDASRDRYLRMAQAFAQFGTTPAPGGIMTAGLSALRTFAGGEAEARKAQRVAEVENMKAQTTLEEARRKEAIGDMDAAEKLYAQHEGHVVSRDNAITQANATIMGHQISAAAGNKANQFKMEQLAGIKADLTKKLGRDPTTTEVLQAYTQATTTADETAAARNIGLARKEYADWEKGLMLDPVAGPLVQKARKGDKDAIAQLDTLKKQKQAEIYSGYNIGGGQQTTAASTPEYSKGQTVDYNGKTYRFKGGNQYDRSNWEAV
jgi:hypothetical protein